MAEKTATWSLRVDSNAKEVAGGSRAELEALAGQVQKSQESLKAYQAALRSLRGSSDEVAKAKTELKARIDAERGAVSQANLALLKQGETYVKVAAGLKAANTQQRTWRDGLKAAGGPLDTVASKVSALKEHLHGANAGMVTAAAGAAALVIGVTALAAGIAGVTLKLASFILKSADSLRSMQLVREAATGSAESAKNLGTWVDYLSRKVPTAKEQLNDLGASLARSMSGGMSRATGQTIVDTFAAVAQASAAAGDTVGGKIREIIERGKTMGRVFLAPQELQGTGLMFSDVAKALAKQMHVSVGEARAALFEGRVQLADGAAAIRTAVEAKFGGINAGKLLSFGAQFDKLGEHLTELSKNVAMEPLLKGLAVLVEKVDPATESGQRLQATFEKIGNTAVEVGTKVAEVFEEWWPKIEKATQALTENKAVMFGLKVVGIGLAVAIGAVAAAIGVVAVTAAVAAAAVGAPFYAIYKGWQFVKNIEWKALGSEIVNGLVNGLASMKDRLVNGVKGLADSVKSAFKSALGIASPSKVFAEYGKQTAAGYEHGTRAGAPAVQRAADDLAPSAPRSSGGRTAGRGDMTTIVNINLEVPSGMQPEHAQAVARQLSAPNVLREITRAVRQGLITQGIPTQATVA